MKIIRRLHYFYHGLLGVAVIAPIDGRSSRVDRNRPGSYTSGRNKGITMPTVKTAISVPEHLFEQMDKLSNRMGVPRSRLFARAVEEFIERRRGEELTAKLDRAYAEGESAEERKLRRASARAFRRLLEGSR